MIEHWIMIQARAITYHNETLSSLLSSACLSPLLNIRLCCLCFLYAFFCVLSVSTICYDFIYVLLAFLRSPHASFRYLAHQSMHFTIRFLESELCRCPAHWHFYCMMSVTFLFIWIVSFLILSFKVLHDILCFMGLSVTLMLKTVRRKSKLMLMLEWAMTKTNGISISTRIVESTGDAVQGCHFSSS